MWTWLCKRLCRNHYSEIPNTAPPWAATLGEQLGDQLSQQLGEQLGDQLREHFNNDDEEDGDAHPSGPPQWAAELTELVQRSARAQSKSALRLEELDRKLEGGLADLRHAIAQAAARPQETLRWDEALDAMDLVEAARATLEVDHPSIAEGLGGVQARLTRHLASGGLSRHTGLSAPPDGTLFRVVGTEDRPDLPDGIVTKVIRAAVRRGDQLVREGEVLTNRRST